MQFCHNRYYLRLFVQSNNTYQYIIIQYIDNKSNRVFKLTKCVDETVPMKKCRYWQIFTLYIFLKIIQLLIKQM